MKEAAVKWLKQAKHDLEMARKNIEIGGYDIAAFLAHQSVEKLLKAVIIAEGKRPPKSHYLDEIARFIGVDHIVNDLHELAADYMISRYPDVGDSVPFEEYDENIALEKVSIADKIFKSLKDRYQALEEPHE